MIFLALGSPFFSFLLAFCYFSVISMWNSLAVCRPTLRFALCFSPHTPYHCTWWISRLDSLVLPFECLAMVFDGCAFVCVDVMVVAVAMGRIIFYPAFSLRFALSSFPAPWQSNSEYFFIDLLRGLVISYIALTLAFSVYFRLVFLFIW